MLDTCLILNGPPNSGKDTLALLLVKHGYTKMAMKDQLYIDTAKLFDVDYDAFVARASDRILKEEPWPAIGDCTPREALIYTSEFVIKPNHGDDYFGLAAAEACKKQNATFAVFSDGGFESEIPPLQAAYKNLFICRLHRNGCTFEGDSRTYMPDSPFTFDLHLIDGKPELAANYLLNRIEQYTLHPRLSA